jgi:hypothetical protein
MAKKRIAKQLSEGATDIREFVMRQPLFGSHSHIQPIEEWAETPGHFSSIQGYAEADLATAAGPMGIGETYLPPENAKDFAKRYFELWRACRFTGYCKATELACRDLLGLEYRQENAAAIGSGIKKLIGRDARASYSKIIRDRANIRWLIKDSINRPDDVADTSYPKEFVRFNYRDDDLLAVRSRADILEREKSWKRSIHSVSDLVAGMNEAISSCLATGKVTCFKIGLPYQRSLVFTEPSLHQAEVAFSRMMNVTAGSTLDPGPGSGVAQQSRVSAEELRPLQDYLTHQYVRRAEEENVGVQVHTGYLAGNSNALNNIRVMDMVPFIMRYPRARFDLFHAGWPYTEEHAAIGKQFPNVWLNLCWAWAMNPVTMESTLDSWLASVPHKKIFAYGGDTASPICEYGYAQQARAGIARVLGRWIDRGDMTTEDAKAVATDIMLMNGCRFHNLPPRFTPIR